MTRRIRIEKGKPLRIGAGFVPKLGASYVPVGSDEKVKSWWGLMIKGDPLLSAKAVARWTGMGLWVYVGIHLRTPEYMRKFRLTTINNLARAGVIRKAIKFESPPLDTLWGRDLIVSASGVRRRDPYGEPAIVIG